MGQGLLAEAGLLHGLGSGLGGGVATVALRCCLEDFNAHHTVDGASGANIRPLATDGQTHEGTWHAERFNKVTLVGRGPIGTVDNRVTRRTVLRSAGTLKKGENLEIAKTVMST